jgi:CTP:molybdopterin cytidylyltransferase MocA/SAM-dependent methyltransferase
MGVMRIIAVVLAAGEGRRMGGPKALLAAGGRTFLARACAALERPGVDGVIAVLGARAARVEEEAGIPPRVRAVRNERWSEGMLTSVWVGLEEAEAEGAQAILVHPVDNPFVTATTVDAVVAALREGATIAVPTHGNRRGHPAGFARTAFAALRRADPALGARSVLAAHPEWIVHVPAGADCLVDVDTPADLAGLSDGVSPAVGALSSRGLNRDAPVPAADDRHAGRFQRERAFHDAWAGSTDVAGVPVEAAFEHLAAPENRFILGRMGDLRGRRVLDLGSGLGESAVYFALRGARVTATDISPEMCALAARTAASRGVSIETVATPAERLDVEAGAYDLAYGANLLHHVADTGAVLAAVRRALRPGGRCFFWDPLAYNPAIWVYRRMATAVRSEDEHPLTFGVLDEFRRQFVSVRHREFWLATLLLFVKYWAVDRIDPNESRYWKRILEEDPRRLRTWFAPLQTLDAALLRLPLVRRLAWNTVIWAEKPA